MPFSCPTPVCAMLFALLGFAHTTAAFGAASVSIIDATGAPVKHAAVVLANGSVAQPNAQTTQIAQRDAEFVPAVSIVTTGSDVHFPNFDRARHHVYSFSEAKAFEIELYRGTPSDPVLFDHPGIVSIGCNVHDWMYGIVYVVDTPYAAITDDKGVAVFEDLAPGNYSIDVWHPQRSELHGDDTLTVDAQGKAHATATVTLHAAAERPQRPAPIKRRVRK